MTNYLDGWQEVIQKMGEQDAAKREEFERPVRKLIIKLQEDPMLFGITLEAMIRYIDKAVDKNDNETLKMKLILITIQLRAIQQSVRAGI